MTATMMTNDDYSVVSDDDDYGDYGNDVHHPPRARTASKSGAISRPPLWRAGGRGGEPEGRGDGRRRWLIMMMIVMMMMMMEDRIEA